MFDSSIPEEGRRWGDIQPLLSAKDICRIFGIKPDTWRRWVRSGRAPRPVVSEHMNVRWSEEDVELFYTMKVGGRDGAASKSQINVKKGEEQGRD